MPHTLIEKLLAAHAGVDSARPGDILDVDIDVRVARDFGGANVVKNLQKAGLGVADPSKTFFTFDCNPTGSDQKYAANQQLCRDFAREHHIKVFDIDQGIGTHLALERGLVGPGSTFVSTDSHANVLGAVGAFGQGMGDVDVAHAFARGRVWFEVPRSVRVVFQGRPSADATAKDLTLAALARFGASGLLGVAAELVGAAVVSLGLAGRVTLASMATEMGAIIGLIPPSDEIIAACRAFGACFTAVTADDDASYDEVLTVDVEGLGPMLSKPGHPEDVAPVESLAGSPVDSVVIGSCTNGRYEDLAAAADVLRGHKVAPGVVLKVVPATDAVWRRALESGLLATFKEAGALVGNAGCAGCAEGQIGQNGPGEVTVSTGNRNFAGKQGQGRVYLASPATAAACAVAGVLTTAAALRAGKVAARRPSGAVKPAEKPAAPATTGGGARPTQLTGRVWVVRHDHVDTDMIFHNRHLAITDPKDMGQHAFGNLAGMQGFAAAVRPGDIVVAGKNFGCGSSRQQAVDCFAALGVAVIVADSFGAIYERNAVNNAFPVMVAPGASAALTDGEVVTVDLAAGTLRRADGTVLTGKPFSKVQMDIYQRGGLLAR